MINLLIADDHAVVRAGLRQIVSSSADISVCSDARTGSEVLDRLRRFTAEVVLLDMSMPGICGLDLIGRLRGGWPQLGILIFSMNREVQIASRALKAGANGYITKDCDSDVILSGIRKVASGGRFVDPGLMDAIVFSSHISCEAGPQDILSNREFQVLQRLAAGDTINDIAHTFSLSAKTISTHKLRLMKKLGLSNNIDLMRYAIQHQIAY